MTLYPRRKQWTKWTLPSKASYLGTCIAVLSILASVGLSIFSEDADAIAGQPQLSIQPSSQPHLRYSKLATSGLELSYELCVVNTGKHPLIDLEYTRVIQTLQVESAVPIVVDPVALTTGPPQRLVSSDHYCQIFMLRNPNLSAAQIADIIKKYDSGEVAILLDLELSYSDAFTGKQFSLTDLSRILKDRVEIRKTIDPTRGPSENL